MDEFIESTIPGPIRMARSLSVGEPQGEQETLAQLKSIMSKNVVNKSMIGQGYYGTHTPGVILRNVLENPGWYTSYTPYQAEISQGRLESLLNYQTMVREGDLWLSPAGDLCVCCVCSHHASCPRTQVADLTGTEFSNASLLDEATAAAEAAFMSFRALRGKRNRFFVADTLHPQSIALIEVREPCCVCVCVCVCVFVCVCVCVCGGTLVAPSLVSPALVLQWPPFQTRAKPLGVELVIGKPDDVDFSSKDFCGAIVQYPDTFGAVEDYCACVCVMCLCVCWR